jgi:hypothetical protein
MEVHDPQQAASLDRHDDGEDGTEAAMVRAFLAKRGIEPDAKTGCYDERDLIEALRARGWQPELRRIERWEVEVPDPWGQPESLVLGAGADRPAALMAALRRVILWMTPDEKQDIFDQFALRLLGMSGEEFKRRWDAGELDPRDPAVARMQLVASHAW